MDCLTVDVFDIMQAGDCDFQCRFIEFNLRFFGIGIPSPTQGVPLCMEASLSIATRMTHAKPIRI